LNRHDSGNTISLHPKNIYGFGFLGVKENAVTADSMGEPVARIWNRVYNVTCVIL